MEIIDVHLHFFENFNAENGPMRQQVKRMMEALGKKVTYLERLSMGPLELPSHLPTGKYRSLTEKELELLKSAGNR